ncbi:ribonuclease P [Halapricum sp. CBA1109]|jgi:ribonuclease P protein subunit RPR2|uniref:ribonuclease P protein component 4 n=1 Tax=Halapricum sp. CBA1109 TaxID=2668068 RepID=UPI0012F9C05C|nr:ribonuclease P [Halapricum sp. CBA1109]MUV90363.1 ribonuclease P [Halapricum sp. CBA1109]
MGREETIARERIEILQERAAAAAREDRPDRSREYVRLARRIAERNRLSLPTRFDRFSCDACDRYLLPGRSVRVRTQDGHVVYTCDCGHQQRHPYGD